MKQMTPAELHQRLANNDSLQLIDVREPEEHAIAHLPGALLIPLGELTVRHQEVDPDQETVVYCHHGIRSMHAIAFLQQQDFENLVNLAGGIDAYSISADPSVPRY